MLGGESIVHAYDGAASVSCPKCATRVVVFYAAEDQPTTVDVVNNGVRGHLARSPDAQAQMAMWRTNGLIGESSVG